VASTQQQDRELNDSPLENEDDLVAKLVRHRDQIRNGTALFNGVPISYESELTQFVRVTGVFLYTTRSISGFYVYDREPTDAPRRGAIAHCLLWGWWSIPWGPLEVIKALYINFTGGLRVRVLDLIGDDTPHREDVVRLTRRAAEAALKQMEERGFPPGSAIRIDVAGKRRPRRYEITYDEVPLTEGRDWISQSNGVTILVFKKDAPRLKGLTVDFQQGAYTFDERTLNSPD
jgi:Fe-S cluster assembly iron-binding protein IscA